jgi:hypothetical protein
MNKYADVGFAEGENLSTVILWTKNKQKTNLSNILKK